jgi:DNA modification methylase
MIHYRIRSTDARSTGFAEGFFQTIVTSPPYWGLRKYGSDPAEIGAGSVADYLSDMRKCATEWLRITADTGVLWLNLADTASGSGGAGGDYNAGGAKQGKSRWRQGEPDRPTMSWLNLPHRVVEEFVATGWLLRADITWDKERLRAEDLSHARRPGVSTERIFMLSKSRNYPFHADRLPDGERGNVWRFPPARGRNHLAPFPLELPLRCIPLTTEPGDAVLDPFLGSGTTMEAAEQLGRVGYGCDIYEWIQP